MHEKPIMTVKELVAAFGGTVAMAEWAQVVPAAVSNWIDRGNVPAGLHLRLDRECRKRGIVVDDVVFGLRPVFDGPPRPSKRSTQAA